MPYLLDQPLPPHDATYAVFKNAFSRAECRRIIAQGEDMQAAQIGGGAVDPKVRSSEVSWLPCDERHAWLYHRLGAVVRDARDHWFPFHLSGMMEDLQLTRYSAASAGHYAPHCDRGGLPNRKRKLSLVCLLSSRSAFSGGQLQFASIQCGAKRAARHHVTELQAGTIIVFPAWELHRVTPVTRGERWSLVTWVHGPGFV